MPRLDHDVFALDVTKLAESLLKSLKQSRRWRIRRQNTDPVHLPRLLRPSAERRGERTSQRGQQEAAAVHHLSPAISASAFANQYVIPISRYIVVALVRCSRACSRLSVRP